jgi:hypothetical protein
MMASMSAQATASHLGPMYAFLSLAWLGGRGRSATGRPFANQTDEQSYL